MNGVKLLLRIYWRPVVWAGFILFLILLPSNDVSKIDFLRIPHSDKIVHFILFQVLSLLLINSRLKHLNIESLGSKEILWVSIPVICYGLVLELVQHFLVASRSGEALDLLANVTGLLAALVFYKKIFSILQRHSKRNI